MGQQIIKQPNGKYALWSGITDNFTDLDCSPQEIIELKIEREAKKITREINNIIDALERKQKPYYQFTKTWEGCLKSIQEIHGEKAANEFIKRIEENA